MNVKFMLNEVTFELVEQPLSFIFKACNFVLSKIHQMMVDYIVYLWFFFTTDLALFLQVVRRWSPVVGGGPAFCWEWAL